MPSNRIIEEIGGYYLMETDYAYRAYSGYVYLVMYQPPTLCQPKQLAGFGGSQLLQAKAYLLAKSQRGAEAKSFERTKKTVTGNLSKGWLPCPHDDIELKMQLRQQGLQVMESTKSHDWYGKPATTADLFSETSDAK